MPSASGLEKIEFLFSANPGLPTKPITQVASGGELSRIMLALKTILAHSDVVPTLIFDEIDSGIGGSMGNIIGHKLKRLSLFHQILLVTHLPQIAAYGELHISVQKQVIGGKTQLLVESVNQQERIREIARMLGGVATLAEEPTAISIKHASELLKQAQ
jgi:DNA repair protein RecN (Recombination protein N)